MFLGPKSVLQLKKKDFSFIFFNIVRDLKC